MIEGPDIKSGPLILISFKIIYMQLNKKTLKNIQTFTISDSNMWAN